MIEVTTFNGDEIMVNAELIEIVKETPDTVISLTSGRTILVKEKAEEIRELVIDYRRLIRCAPLTE